MPATKHEIASSLDAQRLRDQLQRLKGELMRSSRTHEDEQDRIQADADARVAALQLELAAARQAAEGLQSQLHSAQAAASEHAEAARAAEAQGAAVKQQLGDARTANGDVTAHTAEALAAEVEEVRRELETLRSEHAAVLASLGTTETLAAERQQQLESRLRDTEQQLTAAKAELAGALERDNQRTSDMQAEAAGMASRLHKADAAAQAAREELAAERAAHVKAENELSRVQHSTAQQADMKGLEADLAQALADVEGFEELHDATVAEIAGLQSELQARTEQAELAARDVSELQSALDEVTAKCQAVGKQSDELRAHVQQQERVVSAAQAEADRLRRQLESAEAAVAERDVFWQAELAAATAAHEQTACELRQRASELLASTSTSSNSQTYAFGRFGSCSDLSPLKSHIVVCPE